MIHRGGKWSEWRVISEWKSPKSAHPGPRWFNPAPEEPKALLLAGKKSSIRQDRPLNRFNSNRPRPRGIGDSRLLTCLCCTRQQYASGQVVFFVVSQLPLFCNTRITGIRADGAQLGCGPAPGCVRLLLAFFTGSSDLGCHRISILQGPKTVFFVFFSCNCRVTRQTGAI